MSRAHHLGATEGTFMQNEIHPEYVACDVTCGCGNQFSTRATMAELKVDICSACHPFYTGQQKFVDTAGRIEKFNRRVAHRQALEEGEKA